MLHADFRDAKNIGILFALGEANTHKDFAN
jgi:hypothetical protein